MVSAAGQAQPEDFKRASEAVALLLAFFGEIDPELANAAHCQRLVDAFQARAVLVQPGKQEISVDQLTGTAPLAPPSQPSPQLTRALEGKLHRVDPKFAS